MGGRGGGVCVCVLGGGGGGHTAVTLDSTGCNTFCSPSQMGIQSVGKQSHDTETVQQRSNHTSA